MRILDTVPTIVVFFLVLSACEFDQTGGLIGPPGSLGGYGGSLDGTPVFLGSGDPDPHVPWSRVTESAVILEEVGARVRMERYPGRPHTVSARELEVARGMVNDMLFAVSRPGSRAGSE